jgi:hypothetical protein
VGIAPWRSFRSGHDSCCIRDGSALERGLGALDKHTRNHRFAVVILDNYWPIVYTEAIARAYVTGSDATRAALTVPGAAQWIDVKGWLAYGAVGLWVLVCSILSLRNNVWPKGLAYLGILAAFVYFLALASTAIPSLFLSGAIIFVSVIGAVLAPIWYGWMGIVLRSHKSQ